MPRQDPLFFFLSLLELCTEIYDHGWRRKNNLSEFNKNRKEDEHGLLVSDFRPKPDEKS
jgi:hypothetical protein